jgi:segregation and condensation protein A
MNMASHAVSVRLNGEPYLNFPNDLYIPPDALEVLLETFEGPLDLLLYLIKRQNVDILDIPIAEIARQYMDYLTLMQELRLDLAAEYLVMGATLAEIKSRLLLPRPIAQQEDSEEDPRAELVRRLQEYERYKKAAEGLSVLPRLERDVFKASAAPMPNAVRRIPPTVNLSDLQRALRAVLQRAEFYSHHRINREPLSVRERMSQILQRIDSIHFTPFAALFTAQEGRAGVVVTLLAVLELLRESLLEVVQVEPFAPIHLRLCGHANA